MKSNLIGSILLKSDRINQEQLDLSIREQVKTGLLIGETMVSLGFISAEDIAVALAEQLNIPYIDLDEDFKLESEDVRLIPEGIARRFCLIPYKREDNLMIIVMKNRDRKTHHIPH